MNKDLCFILCSESQYDYARRMRKNGQTYKEIQQVIGRASTTIRNWTKDIKLTEQQKNYIQRQGFQKNSIFWRNKRIEYFEKGEKLAEQYKNDSLFCLCCGLYWGEGTKSKGSLDIANTDLYMLKLWKQFLKRYLNINDQQIHIRIYCQPTDQLNQYDIEEYWLKNMDVLRNKLHKTTIIQYKYNNKNKFPYGVCHLTVYGTQYLYTVLGAIKHLGNIQDENIWL